MAANGQPLLSVRNVRTFYGKIMALRGVDVDVHAGEIVALIGANGAGKSTLMMTICGNPQARDGTIIYDGTRHHPHAHPRDRAAPRRPVAGRPAHLPAHDGAGKPADGRQPRRADAFRRATRSASSRCSRASRSARPARRNAFGRRAADAGDRAAPMARPRLLLLDEPSLGLAPLIVKQIFDAIRELNATRGSPSFWSSRTPTTRSSSRTAATSWSTAYHHERHRRGTARGSGGARRLSRRRQALGRSGKWESSTRKARSGCSCWSPVVLGGGAAWMTGRAIANGWQSGQAGRFTCCSSAIARALHPSCPVRRHDVLPALLRRRHCGSADHRPAWLSLHARPSQMVTQYSWMYERPGRFSGANGPLPVRRLRESR